MTDRDPICTHRHDEAVGFVSWPPIWVEDFTQTSGHASTWVCARLACREDAADWCREVTGHVGVFTSFEENRARRAEKAEAS